MIEASWRGSPPPDDRAGRRGDALRDAGLGKRLPRDRPGGGHAAVARGAALAAASAVSARTRWCTTIRRGWTTTSSGAAAHRARRVRWQRDPRGDALLTLAFASSRISAVPPAVLPARGWRELIGGQAR
jgi:hypothetical protein